MKRWIIQFALSTAISILILCFSFSVQAQVTELASGVCGGTTLTNPIALSGYSSGCSYAGRTLFGEVYSYGNDFWTHALYQLDSTSVSLTFSLPAPDVCGSASLLTPCTPVIPGGLIISAVAGTSDTLHLVSVLDPLSGQPLLPDYYPVLVTFGLFLNSDEMSLPALNANAYDIVTVGSPGSQVVSVSPELDNSALGSDYYSIEHSDTCAVGTLNCITPYATFTISTEVGAFIPLNVQLESLIEWEPQDGSSGYATANAIDTGGVTINFDNPLVTYTDDSGTAYFTSPQDFFEAPEPPTLAVFAPCLALLILFRRNANHS